MFELHPQLARDCHLVGDLTLCRVLLMDDANYPWTILVPRRDSVREICELSEADQLQLMRESSQLARAMQTLFHPDKLNIAALGNRVPQLHLHHVARTTNDPAWPDPVWGRVLRQPYDAGRARELVASLAVALRTS